MSDLRKWREDQRLSQAQLGEKLGVTGVAVGRYEAGRVPEPEVLQKIIDVTNGNVTANDWFSVPATETAGEAA